MKHNVFQKWTSLVLALLMVITMVPIFTLTARAAEALLATFEFGDNGSASHYDGAGLSGETAYTDSDYTLTITSPTNVYGGARDAKGNSALKLGTSSKVGSFSFTVPENISKVVINVAGYKTKTVGIDVNGTTETISTLSNNGEYTPIEVDTSSQKTVTFATTTNCRAMIDSIMFYGDSSSSSTCEHANTEERDRIDPTCTEVGHEAGTYCTDCKQYISGGAEIEATGHQNTEDVAEVPATCSESGYTAGVYCNDCKEYISGHEVIAATGRHTYVDGVCEVCGATLPFKVGDVVIFTGSKADGTDTRELSGFDSDTVKFGTAAVYTDTPAGTFPLTVVEGYESGTFAFKNGDNYITCNGEKNVNLSTTLDAKSSWIVELSANGDLDIISCSNTSYYLQYNSGAPRFTTYTGSQQPIKIVKVEPATEPTVKSVALTLNKGVTVNVTIDIPAAWLDEHAGAMVVFSNGKQFEAVAGENVYSVDLTPAQINDALTVEIQNGLTATDVSVATYRAKAVAAGYLETGELIKLIDAALVYSDAADGKSDTLEGNFGTTPDAEVVHNSESAKLFTGLDGKLSTYASIRVNVNILNNPENGTVAITFGGKELYNGSLEACLVGGCLVIDKLCPADFDTTIYIDAVEEGSCAEFTFNSYLKAVYESTTDQQVKNFAAATYLYGRAAEAYIAAK